MAGQLERTRLQLNSYIKDAELKKKFQEIYEQVVEENKNNVVAFIPIGHVDEETLDIGGLTYIDDYEVHSGTRRDEEGNEFDTEGDYLAHLKRKADEEYAGWKVVQHTDDDGETVYRILESDDSEYTCNYSEGESLDELAQLKQDWIEEQTAFDDLDLEYHEVYWNTTWRFNGNLDREVADRVGLGYLEHIHSGEEYLFLLGCGMDLTPKIIAYQALTHGYISESYLRYFQGDLSYTKHVMGTTIWNEVIEKLDIKRFFEQEVSE